MPARATELETYQIRNGRSTTRNVFYLSGLIFFHTEYCKNTSNQGRQQKCISIHGRRGILGSLEGSAGSEAVSVLTSILYRIKTSK